MSRARGANALMAIAFEPSYGIPPTSGFFGMPFVSSNLGEEQGLIESDVLGFGRMPQEPGRGEANDVGDAAVPLCARNIGLWLTALMGPPTTTPGLAATGSLAFSAQPANNSTVTLAGQAFTFVTGTPTANQIKIGATLGATIANAVRAFNGSAVPAVTAALFWADVNGTTIRIAHKALGTTGNSYALAASAVAVTPSGATLTGGAASGGYRHEWSAGALTLPSLAIEIGHPEVPSYSMNYGVKANTLGIPLQRSGNLNATIGLIAQGELPASAGTAAGTPTKLAVRKFSSFSGLARRDGVPFGADLVSGQTNLTNGLDPVPTVGRGDGRVGGVDEGMVGCNVAIGLRYSSTEMQALGENGQPTELTFAWSIPSSIFSLRQTLHAVYLPRAKRPISGPGAVQADYQCQAAQDPVTGRVSTFVLDNDVASYAVA
ncbi:MAG: hypothetical protein JHC81_04880 [Brevundimonas sp.]|uniref:phage tail tube protein n=1 Tax=Brevundimonas sp. TaxID=1871086 RepID=UPI001A31EDC2|nr:phage tail tube protein [Brevundimonas sp.]MBJ7446849.1 hypothetical protein [Brevundimonas sp.]